MIRTSKHILKYQTDYKSTILDMIFDNYKTDLEYYIQLIVFGSLPLKLNLSSSLLPTNIIKHSNWKQIIYKQASEIIRSQIKQSNDRRFKKYKLLYSKCLRKNIHKSFTNKKYSELKLKPILQSKYFTIPKIKNIIIMLDSRLIDFQFGNSFDEFIRIYSPYFQENKHCSIKVNLPIKYHKHSLKYTSWNRKNSISLQKINNNYYLNFFYEKEQLELKQEGSVLGIDQGYKKLLSCSDGTFYGTEMFNLYQEISNKQQGSKGFKKALVHRNNEINKIINTLPLVDLKEIVIENLKNVKYKSKLSNKTMNKLQRWTYPLVSSKLERLSEENGILFTKINPAYTSQVCSSCGAVHKESRQGEEYSCIACGIILDADYNASINISRMGVYRPQTKIS